MAPVDAAPAGPPRADGHAAHEEDQDEGLGVGGMAEEQAQVLTPQGLVDQACEAGQEEDGEDEKATQSVRRQRHSPFA